MRTLLITLALPVLLRTHAQPVFYWTLDEAQGTVAHDAIGAQNGTLVGNCTWQPTGGHHAGALRFYGDDARVELGPCDITTGADNEFSVACWFKPLIVDGTERILVAKSIGNGPADWIWSLSLVNSTGALFRVHAANGVRTAEVPPSSIFSNAWYHLAAVYDGTEMRVYLNGSLATIGSATGGMGFHPEAPATLGNLFDGSLPFYGDLDDVRVYDHALTPQEVVDLVIGDVTTGTDEPRFSTDPLGRLRIPAGEWTAAVVTDASGRMVSTAPIHASQGTLPLSTLASGVYLVRLEGPGHRMTHQVFTP